MFFFYNYQPVKIQQQYVKSSLLQLYINQTSNFLLFEKFNCRTTSLVPKLQSWSYRSLYTHKKHYNQKRTIKKTFYLHLFWVLDIWKLVHPFNLKGISTTFPMRFETTLINPLVVYSALTNWVMFYGINKDNTLGYSVSNNWLRYKPNLWMSRSYEYFVNWCLKNKKARSFRRHNLKFWFLNRYYIENGLYNKIQSRFFLKIPTVFPTNYTKIFWLRLMQYPCLYNYYWFPMLKQLSLYGNDIKLPWELLYTSKQVWMFNHDALALSKVLHFMLIQGYQIVDYMLIKQFKHFLENTDAFSVSFQMFCRDLYFIKYTKNTKLNLFLNILK